MTGPCLCFPPVPGNWPWVHWSWFGPKHIPNNTLSVSLSVTWLLCQYLWFCDHGAKTQGEENVRQGGGGEPHRQAGRDGIQGGAEEEGELRDDHWSLLQNHSRWKLAVKLVSFHCVDWILDIYLTFFCLSLVRFLQTIILLADREVGGERLEGSGEGGLQGRGEGAWPRQDHRRGPGPGNQK